MNEYKNISIGFPLKGEWRFLRPPGHHPFAFDFVKMDERRKKYSTNSKINFLISNIPANDYFCWEQPVYSPINGTVLQVGIDWEDHIETNIWKTIKLWYCATYRSKPTIVDGKLDLRSNVGNYVMIRSEEGFIVFVAHLKNGSTIVTEGQSVNVGDFLGSVGNSGNSTAPHLHINLFDQMDNPYEAKVLPFVFTEYEELGANDKWVSHTNEVPKVKSIVRLS